MINLICDDHGTHVYTFAMLDNLFLSHGSIMVEGIPSILFIHTSRTKPLTIGNFQLGYSQNTHIFAALEKEVSQHLMVNNRISEL